MKKTSEFMKEIYLLKESFSVSLVSLPFHFWLSINFTALSRALFILLAVSLPKVFFLPQMYIKACIPGRSSLG